MVHPHCLSCGVALGGCSAKENTLFRAESGRLLALRWQGSGAEVTAAPSTPRPAHRAEPLSQPATPPPRESGLDSNPSDDLIGESPVCSHLVVRPVLRSYGQAGKNNQGGVAGNLCFQWPSQVRKWRGKKNFLRNAKQGMEGHRPWRRGKVVWVE